MTFRIIFFNDAISGILIDACQMRTAQDRHFTLRCKQVVMKDRFEFYSLSVFRTIVDGIVFSLGFGSVIIS